MKRLGAVVALSTFSLIAACASSNPSTGPSATGTSAGSKKKASTEIDPLYSLTYMRQGSVQMQQGRFDAALESFKTADRIAPGNATNKNMIGLCYLRMGQPDQALRAFDEALAIIPGFTDARNNRGAAYLSMGQYHLAEVDFVAVLGDPTYPHRKQVFYNLGMTYLQRDQLGAAEENFRKSIVTPNPVFDGFIKLSSLAQRQGELERARSVLEDARLEFPEKTEVAYELGKLLMIMGREDEARPYLQRVIADAPDSAEAETARALLGQG